MATNTEMKKLLQNHAKQAALVTKTDALLTSQAQGAEKLRQSIYTLALRTKNKAKTEIEKTFWNSFEAVADKELLPAHDGTSTGLTSAMGISLAYSKSIDADHKAMLRQLKEIEAAVVAAKVAEKKKIEAEKKAAKLAAADAKKVALAEKKANEKAKADAKKAEAKAKADAKKRPASSGKVKAVAAPKAAAAEKPKVTKVATKKPAAPKPSAPKVPAQTTLEEGIETAKETAKETSVTMESEVPATRPSLEELMSLPGTTPSA